MASEVYQAFLEANRNAQLKMGKAPGHDRWVGSPFEWLMTLPSSTRGKAGEILGAIWLEQLGYEVLPRRNPEHDRVVADRTIEIKFSSVWAAGVYKFQQLRDQDYQFVLLLGVSPTIAHCWVVPKEESFANARPQHGGARAIDTKWISFPASTPPAWLAPHGGDLDEAIEAINRHLGPPQRPAR